MIYNINNTGGSTGNMIIRVTVPDDKVGKTITCTLDSTVLTDTVPASLEVEFKVKEFGDWLIECDGLSKTINTYYYGLYLVNIERPIVPLVPIMTSNTTPYGKASAKTERSSEGMKAFKAFGDNLSSSNYDAWADDVGGETTESWLSYSFVNPVKVKRVGIGARYSFLTNYPTSFTIQGSNDEVTWENLKNETISSAPTNTSLNFYDIPENKQDYYLHYRVYTYGCFYDRTAIGRLQFYGY